MNLPKPALTKLSASPGLTALAEKARGRIEQGPTHAEHGLLPTSGAVIAAALLWGTCTACGEELDIHLLKPVGVTAAQDAGAPVSISVPTAPVVDAMTEAPTTEDAAAEIPTQDAGAAETPTTQDAAAADSAAPHEAVTLIHHYDFEGAGTTLSDRVGEAHGEILGGAALDRTGSLTLDGVDDYVNLPNGLISSLNEATLSMRLTWRGGPCWQRLFDFGSSVDGEDTIGVASTSLYVAATTCPDAHFGPVRANSLSCQFHVFGSTYIAQHEEPLPTNRSVQVALTLAPENGFVLYQDGVRVAEATALIDLGDIIDENVWLGRSQWEFDSTLAASLDDFRIYSNALSDEEIVRLFAMDAP